jgi:hypothetical protein
MKKYLLLCISGLCYISVVAQAPQKPITKLQSDSLILLFRNQTGIRALAVLDSNIVRFAKLSQHSATHPGVDRWVAAKIPKNISLYGGLPGQSPFFSVSKTVKDADTLLIKYWKSLQVESSQIYGYRPWLGVYGVKDTIVVALAQMQANPQYGKGGAWQLFVKDHAKNLILNDTIKLRSSNRFAN